MVFKSHFIVESFLNKTDYRGWSLAAARGQGVEAEVQDYGVSLGPPWALRSAELRKSKEIWILVIEASLGALSCQVFYLLQGQPLFFRGEKKEKGMGVAVSGTLTGNLQQ